MKKRAVKNPRTLLEGKVYNPETDVQRTWQKFGWKPSGRAAPSGNEPVYQQAGARRMGNG